MADIAQIRALLEQLPITDEYGAAREVGGVLLKVLEDADRASAAKLVRRKIEADTRSETNDDADTHCIERHVRLGAGFSARLESQ